MNDYINPLDSFLDSYWVCYSLENNSPLIMMDAILKIPLKGH